MNYIITESQEKKLYGIVQSLIDSELNSIKEESEDWGREDMKHLSEIESIEQIKIDRIVSIDRVKVYLDIYVNEKRYDFDYILSELQFRLKKWIPNIVFFVNEIIDTRTSGPGIDW